MKLGCIFQFWGQKVDLEVFCFQVYVTVRDMISGRPEFFFDRDIGKTKKVAWTLGKVRRPSPMQDPEKYQNLCQKHHRSCQNLAQGLP